MTTNPMKRPPLVRVLLLVAGALAIVMLTRIPQVRSIVDPQGFARIPEATLYYPGSVVLAERHAPASGPSPAAYLVALSSDAPMEDIIAFYRAEFRDRPGWANDGSESSMWSTLEAAACTWHNESVTVRIGFPDKERWLKRQELTGASPNWPSTTLYHFYVLDKTSQSVSRDPC
jgi:hypothetical protein